MKTKLLVMSAILTSACAPKVYVIDRQTILQSEATGEFPNLEKSLEKHAMQYGPKMVDRSQLKKKESQQRAFNIINGELTGESSKK